MKDFDQKIQAALRATDSAAPAAAEPNLAEEVLATFRGRHRWLTTAVFAVSFGFFAAAVWAGLKFYRADTVTTQLQWGGVALLLMLVVMFVKVWLWLEMSTNRVLREVKRIELLLVAQRRE